MTKYSFKENFFSTSTTAIDIYDEQNQAVFALKLYYASTAQETFAWLGKKKHNFEIPDGQDIFRVRQERSVSGKIKTPFKTVWEVEKNNEAIGTFRTKIGFKPKMIFEGVQGDALTFQSGFISRSVNVTNDQNQTLMTTKSERFKIASRHDIDIQSGVYNPAMLLLLFQVFYEFQEYQRSKSD